MSNLKAVLEKLRSEKAKDRQEGLSSIRSVFSQDRVIANFHIDSEGVSNPRAWLIVFQALFQAVLNEIRAITKKATTKSAGSTAMAQKRLADAASVVRWLTEKTAHFMNKRVTKALLDHILQITVHQSELFNLVALDYAKALRCLVSFTPHLEHMEDETWIRVVEIGFNNVLGDPMKATFDDDAAVSTLEADDSDLFMEDAPDSDDFDETDALPSGSRKRSRRETSVAPGPSVSAQRRNIRNARRTSVTLEQLEFMSIISILLRSSSSPILSTHYQYLPSSILLRLQRFLDLYTSDTSLLYDYIVALSSTLSHLALNKTRDVQKFAYTSWDGLVGLWGTKNKRIKEGLVAVLRVLFPFVTIENVAFRENGTSFDCVDGISRLSHLLDGEADLRGGMDGLTLDSLRLELCDRQAHQHSQTQGKNAFIASTFRWGWNFGSTQALAWAILELQADCIGKLFQLSEAVHLPSTPNTRHEGKRVRLNSPVTSLLTSIQRQPATNVRAYRLQILLFFIERHWVLLHNTLKQDVVRLLLQFVSLDDTTVQSWVFLCLAAVVYAESSGLSSNMDTPTPSLGLLAHDGTIWDTIWTNAIRRANVPTVCRAACHAAYTILLHAHSPQIGLACISLPPQRILLEIETLAKDLDVQGPPVPYDSVCNFLSYCLRVSGQDMRLYRMQLEEKVLSWLVDCWKVVGMKRKTLSSHMVQDLMLLLESICGLTKRTDLVSRIPLPECQIVETLTEEARTVVIRDFLLAAHLPNFRPPRQIQRNESGSLDVETEPHLSQPRGRERRISTFLLKSLEHLLSEWDEDGGHPTAETARRTLDMAITALSFESALVLNGTEPNRRLIQCACKLIAIVTALLTDLRWTLAEKAMIVLGLDPLTFTDSESEEGLWETMSSPNIGSGIKAHILKRLGDSGVKRDAALHATRMNFLRIVWQDADVQSAFGEVSRTLRSILRVSLGYESNSSTGTRTMDDKDGFGPIRTAATQQRTDMHDSSEDNHSNHFILDVCIAFLTVGPTLQSASGEPTRDKDLMELVLDCSEPRPDMFLLTFPIVLRNIRQRTLNCSVKSLDDALNELSRLLQLYAYARSEQLQSLATQFLTSTVDIWASPGVAIGEALDKVKQICKWLSGALRKKKIRAWAVRDLIARFLDRYLLLDPTEAAWSIVDEQESNEVQEKPSVLLPMMGADEDMRVRFRVAVINARLFTFARRVRRPPPDMYNSIKQSYTVDLDNYEHMLTRMLSLGNIMVVSSAVRRGPYWHLLETCIHSPIYSRHIESILNGVAQRLGLEKLSALFESYASQLAYSIRQSESDFLRFPPHLLGYRDRKECAQATFHAFTPTNVWNGGRKLFESHCRVISKPVEDGLRECFGDILGYQIVAWIDEHHTDTDALRPYLESMTIQGYDFQECLAQNIDGIVASILRTLGDQDFSDDGPIAKALYDVDQTGSTVKTFQALTRYRRMDDFETHQPNLPAFPTETVLQALNWLRSQAPAVDAKATTYHVLHQLFSDIDQSPLVNEQIRLFNAMSVWIAIHHHDFDEVTLLYTLIHGATILLGQSDLARTSQSLLDWSFGCYRRVKLKHPRLPDILVRIACFAHDYSLSTSDAGIATMGNEILQWTDAQALKISKVSTLASQVLRALPAWPHQPSPQLAELYDSITSESLSTVLGDPRIASSKFRLVRRLRDRAISKDYDEENFAKSDFWRLKECIPPVEQLQDTDVDAFAGLLYLTKSRLDSFRSESLNPTSILNRHRRGLPKSQTGAAGSVDIAREPITLTLLAMLQGDSGFQSNVAYQTLRLVKSVSVNDIVGISVAPSEHQTELQYLEAYRRAPRNPCSRDVAELLSNESFMNLTRNFSQWVAEVTKLLSDVLSAHDAFYAQMIPILQSNTAFAEQVLPILVHTLLRAEKASPESKTPHRTILSTYFSAILSSGYASVPCLRSLIETVLHLRHFPFGKSFNPSPQDALSYNKWLEVDFILLAHGAITCSAFTTALLFLELAAEVQAENASSEDILYEIYRHIDEPDGFYGINDKDLHQNLMKRFHHEKQWEKAFRFHGAALEADGSHGGHVEGLVKSFHYFGFDHLANETLQDNSFHGANTRTSPSTRYRLAWRTETWDLPDCDEQSTGASLYLALRAIHRERDERKVDGVLRRGLSREMMRLRALGSENFTEIREVVQDLMCLHEVVKWRSDFIQVCLTSKHFSGQHWDELAEVDFDFDFLNLENIMATRISLIRSARQKEERQQIGDLVTPFAQGLKDIEKRCLIRLSEAARAANQVQIALNSVVRAQRLETIPSLSVFEEFASVLWSQKEEKVAVEFLDRLRLDDWQVHIGDTVSDTQKALLLARLGAWSSAACLKKPTDIQEDYFKAATDILVETDESNHPSSLATQATVYHECAIFAERQYHAIIKSPDAIRWKVYVDRKRQEIQTRSQQLLELKPGTSAHESLRNNQAMAQKILQQDSELFRVHNVACDTFLKESIGMYSRCLQASDAFDGDAAIRLCSLWFANFDDEGTSLQEEVQRALERVPSRKFIFLAHQLSARISKCLSGPTPKNQQCLQSLVLRMCYEHPFHSLYQVYCLQPDSGVAASSQRRHSSRISPPSTQSERSAAAGDIFDQLRADPRSGGRVRDIERLATVCMEWAKYPIKPAKGQTLPKGDLPVPKDASIGRISGLRVPVLTHHTPLDATMRYDDCPWIDHYESTFTTAGGNNLPKIINCYGTDGVKYKQLFKGEGNDDLRQDAVMEQVFDLVNGILHRDRETHRRLLSVRDYKVIPLDSLSGVLEFVGNTLPLQRWLANAHARYHPDDIPFRTASAVIQKAQKEKKSVEEMVVIFEGLKKKFRPVMRHFFTERHKTPIAWFAMRLNYTRSVATTSIVGHLLGLGDRHTSNILLDNVTGQVVHIDLGIAFDQGKLLPIPELVPFRMTRDIVDGMGMSGTSGVFQRCAEETLRVLREGSEVIMTVLEVFKHDPLHSWTASDVKIQRVQQGVSAAKTTINRFGTGIDLDLNSGTAEEAADRALSSVARKLDKSLSVQYTVNQLVREATDTRNLAQIFSGWSAIC
ncbi:Serine/threonine-protein kinase TEL1 [Hypsizygus marmoreus]|uniref:Serine/threonine-protein kinase Tel1 n=1 Tax=Hypsizygus marmoreus TaxID=39966 RepID=A0A369JJU1_HYPMA|nr:Serine/threonine-protein kinase TEL1 [Hypsizygus marmoreus]